MPRTLNKGAIITASVMLAFFVTIAILSSLMKPPVGQLTSGGLWPLMVSSFTAVFCLALLLGTLLRKTEQKGEAPKATIVTQLVLGLIVVYMLVVPLLGYLLSTVLFMALLLRVSGVKSIKTLVILPLGFSAAVYFIFYKVFFVPLPMGLLHL